MPEVDTILLPLCVALTLLGVIATGLAWRKGNKGRVVQGVGLALAPLALYFTGLLGLFWKAVVAVVGWAASIVFSPSIWFGFSLLGLCVVLWVVGGFVARRFTPAKATRKADAPPPTTPALTSRTPPAQRKPQQRAGGDAVDDDMAEIEALLKSRGIE